MECCTDLLLRVLEVSESFCCAESVRRTALLSRGLCPQTPGGVMNVERHDTLLIHSRGTISGKGYRCDAKLLPTVLVWATRAQLGGLLCGAFSGRFGAGLCARDGLRNHIAFGSGFFCGGFFGGGLLRRRLFCGLLFGDCDGDF